MCADSCQDFAKSELLAKKGVCVPSWHIELCAQSSFQYYAIGELSERVQDNHRCYRQLVGASSSLKVIAP